MYLKHIDKYGKSNMIQIFGFEEITNGVKVQTIKNIKVIELPVIGETYEIWDGGICHFQSKGIDLDRKSFYPIFEEKFPGKKATYVRDGSLNETKAFVEWYTQEVAK